MIHLFDLIQGQMKEIESKEIILDIRKKHMILC